jgi:hypothetical protein
MSQTTTATDESEVGNKIFCILAILFNTLFIRNVLFSAAAHFQLMDFPSLPFIKFAIYLNFASLALLVVLFFLKKYRKYIVGFLLLIGLFSLCLMLWLTPRYPTIIFASFFFIGGIILALCCMEFVVPHEFRRLKVFSSGLLVIAFAITFNSFLPRKMSERDFESFFRDVGKLAERAIFFETIEHGLNAEKNTIVDVKKFIAASKKIIESRMRQYKPYFDTNVFEFMLVNNTFSIRMNITNAAFYRSSMLTRDPQASARRLALSIASYLDGRIGQSFFGDPDFFALKLFRKEMDNIYMMLFLFSNNPPVSITFDKKGEY